MLPTAAVLLAAVILPSVAVRTEASAAEAPVRATTSVPAGGGLALTPAQATSDVPPVSAGGTTPPARVRAAITRFALTRSTWTLGGAAPQVRVRIDARRATAATVQLRIEHRTTHRLVVRQQLGAVASGVDVVQALSPKLADRPGRYRLRLVVTDATGHRARRQGAPAIRTLAIRRPAAPQPIAAPPAGSYVFPVQGPCNFRTLQAQRFNAGRSGGRRHNGQDIGTYDGFPPVVAAAAGRISRVWWDDGGGGWTLVIDGDDGIAYGYLHLKPGSIVVRAGDRVTPGQRVANAGNSGGDYEPHLHFEMRPRPWDEHRDDAIDPMPFLVALPNPCDG